MFKQNLKYRKIFEKYSENTISERTWYRYREILEKGGYQINAEIIEKLAELKKHLHELNLKTFTKFLTINSDFNLEDSDEILGKDFLKLIEKEFNLTIHRSTISKWFKSVDGYNPEKSYIFSNIKIVAVKAYKLSLKNCQ